jgi:hypothetical protein
MINSRRRHISVIMFVLVFLSCASTLSCKPGDEPISTNSSERTIAVIKKEIPISDNRVALVIGNGDYDSAPLSNPVNDVRSISSKLKSLKFDVTTGINLNQREMKTYIDRFGRNIRNGGVGLFYYAGHGMQIDGTNYLIPVKSKITSEKDVEYEAVRCGRVLSEMDKANNHLNIVILDACRNNPFARSFRGYKSGLAYMDAPSGTIIAYATAPGSVSHDGTGQNSIYTHELLKHMAIEGIKIEDMFKLVRRNVRENTQNNQTPWESSSLEGNFYFYPSEKQASATKDLVDSNTWIAEEKLRLRIERERLEHKNRQLEDKKRVQEEVSSRIKYGTGELFYNEWYGAKEGFSFSLGKVVAENAGDFQISTGSRKGSFIWCLEGSQVNNAGPIQFNLAKEAPEFKWKFFRPSYTSNTQIVAGNTYYFHLRGGYFAKLRITDIQKKESKRNNDVWVRFEYSFQPDGTRSF